MERRHAADGRHHRHDGAGADADRHLHDQGGSTASASSRWPRLRYSPTSDRFSGLNVIETISEHTTSPVFAGVKTDVAVDGTALQAGAITGGVEPEGLYEFDGDIDLGEVFTSRVTPIIDVSGEDVTNVMSLWTSLSSVTALDTSSQSSGRSNWKCAPPGGKPAGMVGLVFGAGGRRRHLPPGAVPHLALRHEAGRRRHLRHGDA